MELKNNNLLMKYYLMGLKHFKNVAIACAPDNVGLAHELICALRDSEVMPFDFTLKALMVKSGRTRQTLWSAVQMLTQKLCCQTIHDCPKVVPLHYESE